MKRNNDNTSRGPSLLDLVAIVLQLGTSHRYSISFKEDFFKTEGFYKISLGYDGRSQRRSKSKPAAPALFDGRIQSNWLIFEVEYCGSDTMLRLSR